MMRFKLHGVALIGLLLCVLASKVQAQSASGAPPKATAGAVPFADVTAEALSSQPKAETNTRMAEDIEIMREILRRAFGRGPRGVAFFDYDNDGDLDIYVGNTPSAVGMGVAAGDFDKDGWVDFYVANQQAGGGGLYRNSGQGRFTAVDSADGAPAVEGVFLKGYGVVFHATLPESAWPKRTEAAVAGPKPPAKLWDRVRRQLMGEAKPQTKASDEPPGVDAVVLKLLADNGHNFTQLAANEKITVVLVFRKESPKKVADPENRSGRSMPMGGAMGGGMMGGGGGMPGGGGGMPDGGTVLLGGGPAGGGMGAPSMPADARNLEMLGDLHQKQGNAKEAASAYYKAYSIHASKGLATKAMQAFLSAGDVESLRAAQELLSKVAKQAEAASSGASPGSKKRGMGGGFGSPRATSAYAPPRKLVITITKDAADQVAQGKMSFSDFAKKAVVERQ